MVRLDRTCKLLISNNKKLIKIPLLIKSVMTLESASLRLAMSKSSEDVKHKGSSRDFIWRFFKSFFLDVLHYIHVDIIGTKGNQTTLRFHSNTR